MRRKRPDSLDAYDLILQLHPDANSATPQAAIKALALPGRPLALAPSYALAQRLLSGRVVAQAVTVDLVSTS